MSVSKIQMVAVSFVLTMSVPIHAVATLVIDLQLMGLLVTVCNIILMRTHEQFINAVNTKLSYTNETDINECQEGTHHCGLTCINTVGSYMCQCNEGFRLDGDMQTCNGKLSFSCILLSWHLFVCFSCRYQ